MKHRIDPDTVCVDDLPGILRDMTRYIGLAATMTIVQHFGGVRLYVPMTMTADHVLARLIGLDAALILSKEYGGLDHFDIPRAAVAIRAARNTEIADKYLQGTTLRQLALAYMMTERGVTKILAMRQISQEDRQSALF